MKIIKLIAQNIKNLRAIEIEPEGDAVILSGKNGVGKSAVLDAILSTLTGQRLKDAVRHGQDRADVTVETEKFTAKKVWTDKGERLEVYSLDKEGKKIKYSSPQTFLDELIGDLSFDPMAFKDMDAKGQIELLKDIAGLTFDEIEKDKAVVYEERTTLNSKIKEAVAHLTNTEAPDPKTPDVEIAFKDALKGLQELRDKKQAYADATQLKKNYEECIRISEEEIIADTEKEIERLQSVLKKEREVVAENKKTVAEFVIPETITQEQIIAAESALEDIEKKNADIRAAKRYRQSVKDADKLKKQSDTLTEKMRRLDQDKSTQVANAKFPIPDLSLTDEAVMYKGDRFDRLSTGQQIRVSTAIGMALNPELKVIFIREGSLLDSSNLKDVTDQAKDKGYQVWIERCDESGQVGFYIEAGEIKAVEGKETAKK